jgi:hypothetical protein
MPDIVSTIKPKVEQKPEVKIEYNDRSYQSYVTNGFADNIPHSISAPRDRIQDFLLAVDTRQGPIERTVTTIVRLKAIDWTTKKHERKEYLYYLETWHAKNWLGVPLEPINEHYEGRYTEVITKPILDQTTGIHKDNAFGGTREVYTIPFSKKNVDEIIAKSARSDKTGIKYVVKFAAEDSPDGAGFSTRSSYSYDQFVNWSWDKLYEWQTSPWEEMAMRPKAEKSATKLEFKPS